MLPNATLINHPANDGDSFHVEAAGKHLHVRLYFVDCPEISVMSKSDARRVSEQSRYFGLPSVVQTVHYGNEAKKFVSQTLSKPFTVYTSFASALGRSAKGRVYGFVKTADGDDLASLLVKHGLARTYGVGRQTPDGISRSEMTERLRDLETAAMLKRNGIWAESDPNLIAPLRAEQRREDQKLKELQNQIKKAGSKHQVFDLNKVSKEDLESILEIGPVIASRIISGRPFNNVDDLIKVKGIGKKKLKKIRGYFLIGKE
ncbi:MAG: helix-hairpin-helix domain-containing protein [Candidatus Desulfatibia sp.]|uniref:helix-hairpin-helix domain-containing protein n=1 Tax=Candidatus Desulfatibia sp. TaxID=3101189 RepID=UPI002F2EEEF5